MYGYVWNSPYNFIDPFGFQGLGETIADWFDSKIEKARSGAQRDASNWIWNAAVNTLADLASIAPDVLRFGKGIGCALFNDQASGYDKAWAVARDVGRGLTVPGVGIAARAAFRAAKGIGKAVSKTSASRKAETFFQGARYSPKVLRQMSKKNDAFHSFPKSVDAYATKYGQWSKQIGADGKTYQWLKMKGTYRGKTGTFEFIKDSKGVINHRFFNVER